MGPDSLRGEHLLRPVHAAKPLAATPRAVPGAVVQWCSGAVEGCMRKDTRQGCHRPTLAASTACLMSQCSAAPCLSRGTRPGNVLPRTRQDACTNYSSLERTELSQRRA
jgi:hypothetical protein